MNPDDVFAFLFDHHRAVFGVLLVLAIMTMLRIGRPRRWWKWGLDAMAVVAIAVSIAALWFFTAVGGALDRRLETLTFITPGDARPHRLADYRGKVVLLNYWATWCPPCRAEMPDLNRVVDTWRGRDVVFLALTDEDEATVTRYLARQPIHATVGRFTSAAPRGGIELMSYQGRPTTMIIGRDGRVATRLIGARKMAEFERALKRAL